MKRGKKRGRLTDLEKLVLQIRRDPKLQTPPGRVKINEILQKHGYTTMINVPRVVQSIKEKGYKV